MQILNGDWAGAWETIEQTVMGIWDGIQKFFNGLPAVFFNIARPNERMVLAYLSGEFIMEAIAL
jgi:hypothetical protein